MAAFSVFNSHQANLGGKLCCNVTKLLNAGLFAAIYQCTETSFFSLDILMKLCQSCLQSEIFLESGFVLEVGKVPDSVKCLVVLPDKTSWNQDFNQDFFWINQTPDSMKNTTNQTTSIAIRIWIGGYFCFCWYCAGVCTLLYLEKHSKAMNRGCTDIVLLRPKIHCRVAEKKMHLLQIEVVKLCEMQDLHSYNAYDTPRTNAWQYIQLICWIGKIIARGWTTSRLHAGCHGRCSTLRCPKDKKCCCFI